MPTHVRLVHKTLGTEHVYTSPDIQGFHVSADTKADAQREAMIVLHAIADDFGEVRPTVEFEEAELAVAA